MAAPVLSLVDRLTAQVQRLEREAEQLRAASVQSARRAEDERAKAKAQEDARARLADALAEVRKQLDERTTEVSTLRRELEAARLREAEAAIASSRSTAPATVVDDAPKPSEKSRFSLLEVD